MAKTVRRKPSLDTTAESIGASLGHLVARLDSWKKERAHLASDIGRLLHSARSYLADLGHSDKGDYVAAPPPPRNKGSRRKGYKMPEATKAKLRAAWKKRKAADAKGRKSGGAGVGNG